MPRQLSERYITADYGPRFEVFGRANRNKVWGEARVTYSAIARRNTRRRHVPKLKDRSLI